MYIFVDTCKCIYTHANIIYTHITYLRNAKDFARF